MSNTQEESSWVGIYGCVGPNKPKGYVDFLAINAASKHAKATKAMQKNQKKEEMGGESC